MKTAISSAVALAALSVSGSSWASLQFCNQTSNTVYVAFAAEGYHQDNASGFCYNYPFMSSWYSVSPNDGCTTVWSQQLNQVCMDQEFYFYAQDDVGDYWGGSSAYYCPDGTYTAFFPQATCTASYVGFEAGNFNDNSSYTVNLY